MTDVLQCTCHPKSVVLVLLGVYYRARGRVEQSARKLEAFDVS